MGDIDNIIRRSIDMHVHHDPDSLIKRRLDALQTAKQAQGLGFERSCP